MFEGSNQSQQEHQIVFVSLKCFSVHIFCAIMKQMNGIPLDPQLMVSPLPPVGREVGRALIGYEWSVAMLVGDVFNLLQPSVGQVHVVRT